MIHFWTLQNYSRCYQDYQYQTFNSERTVNIHQFFTSSKNNNNLRDYNVNTELWSSIYSKDPISIEFKVHVYRVQSGSIQLNLVIHDKSYNLVIPLYNYSLGKYYF